MRKLRLSELNKLPEFTSLGNCREGCQVFWNPASWPFEVHVFLCLPCSINSHWSMAESSLPVSGTGTGLERVNLCCNPLLQFRKRSLWNVNNLPQGTAQSQADLGLNPAFITVLVSWGCCNKWTQAWWLKSKGTYSLTVLEAGSLKSRCCQGCAPSRGSRGQPLPCLFLPLLALRHTAGLWSLLSCLIFTCLLLCVSSPPHVLQGHWSFDLRPTQIVPEISSSQDAWLDHNYKDPFVSKWGHIHRFCRLCLDISFCGEHWTADDFRN